MILKKQLDIIQVFRGLAAFFVVIHHIVPSLSYFQNLQYPFLNYLASMGKYGVDFFFILSGFIINYANSFKRNNNIKKFIKNRIIRIYIPYLPIGISLFFLYLLFPSFSESSRQISMVTSFTLIPHGNPALAVAWTLSFEMFFYLIYTICIINRRAWHLLIGIWSFTILIVNVLSLNFETPFLQLVFSPYILEFLLGYLLSLLIVKNIRINKYVLAISGAVLFLVFLVSKYYNIAPFPFYTNFVFVFFAFFLIYLCVEYGNMQIGNNNLLMMIGNSSYSLYLVHGPVHSFIERYLPKTSHLLIFLLYIFVVAATCIVAGYVYYLIFEKRAISLLRK